MTGPLARMQLSDRERLLLKAYAEGHSDRRIARALDLHEDTVYSAGRRLRVRIGATNRANAVAIAFRNGWLSLPPTPQGRPSCSPL